MTYAECYPMTITQDPITLTPEPDFILFLTLPEYKIKARFIRLDVCQSKGSGNTNRLLSF
jgi:hypothetical protein